LLDLGALAAADFIPVVPDTARHWANSPEGEWTASVRVGEAVLQLGEGQCSLGGVSVYQAQEGELRLRLSFDGCAQRTGVRHAGVELLVRRAEEAGCSGLLAWMCSLMPHRACWPPPNQPATPAPSPAADGIVPGAASMQLQDIYTLANAELDLACELGSQGISALRQRVAPLVGGCYEAFDWIQLDSRPAQADGADSTEPLAGAALSVNGSEWELLLRRLPVMAVGHAAASMPPSHSIVTSDRVCVAVGPSGACARTAIDGTGVGGASFGSARSWGGSDGGFWAYVGEEWWKWLLIAVLSGTGTLLAWQTYGQKEKTIGIWVEEFEAGSPPPQRTSEPKAAYNLVPHAPFWE